MKLVLHKKTLFTLALLAWLFNIHNAVKAQSMMSLKGMFLSCYPLINDNNRLMSQRSLDGNGAVVLEPGAILSYQSYVRGGNIAFKLMQGFYSDGANQIAGFSHVNVRLRLFEYYKHSLEIGVGPTVHYRQSWREFVGYYDDGFFDEKQGWQYRISWVSGEIEYNYVLYNRAKRRVDISVSINHQYPQGFCLSGGLRYWISKKKKLGPCKCPSFH